MSPATTNNEADILARVIGAREPRLSRAAAESILELRFGAEDRERVEVLADRARAGELTPSEHTELESDERVGCLLGILQSRARLCVQAEDSPDECSAPS